MPAIMQLPLAAGKKINHQYHHSQYYFSSCCQLETLFLCWERLPCRAGRPGCWRASSPLESSPARTDAWVMTLPLSDRQHDKQNIWWRHALNTTSLRSSGLLKSFLATGVFTSQNWCLRLVVLRACLQQMFCLSCCQSERGSVLTDRF